MTGIDVHAHDIRFVEDNWESPVIIFHLFSGSILSYIFSCILRNSKIMQFHLLIKFSCSCLVLSQKTLVHNMIIFSWFFYAHPRIILGAWCLGFGLGNLDGRNGDYPVHLLPAGSSSKLNKTTIHFYKSQELNEKWTNLDLRRRCP